MIQEIDFSSVNDVIINENAMDVVNFNNDNAWKRYEPTIFSVKRFRPQDIQSNGPAGSHIKFVVTAGIYDAYAEYGGNITTIPAGTSVTLSYGTDGTTDDGTPESGNITFSGDIAQIAGVSWDYGSKSTKSGYGCITGVIQWGSIRALGAYLFSNAKLTNVDLTMSNRITKIANSAFFRCNIEKVKLPKYYVELGSSVFEDSEISSFEFPEWLSKIPTNFLGDCSNLTSVLIPNTVQTMEFVTATGGVFQGSALQNVEFEPSPSLKNIGSYAFAETSKLKQIIIPEGIIGLDSNSFWDSALENVSLPKSLLTIDSTAFRSTNLVSVTIPENVNKIAIGAFYECASLTSIIFENPNGWVDKNGNSIDFSDSSANVNLLNINNISDYYTRS